MSRTVGDGLSELRGKLAAAGIESSAREARRIMAAALGVAPDRVSLMQTDPLPHAAEDRLSGMAARRCAREPLAHILGLRAFYRHEFRVTRHVLDPRPETEVLVEAGLGAPFERVLDLGTGTGCILLSLLAARPGAEGTGTDISEEALAVARENAQGLGVADRCNLLKSDWFSAVEGQFDLIVSNPPYIAAWEMDTLEPELRYEPRGALTDEGDGLTAYRAIAAGAMAHLGPGGRLLLEIGWRQGPDVSEILRAAGFDSLRILSDLDGRDRVVSAARTLSGP
ncbi:peptide chain release factor N(5)-glutamine methyltransferase [Roseovarius indicus]|uniref:Release factor glutamine methyltransferase n=1 Tax=Roseovarius indicus TaxID=540747 RepID=A0A0T5P9B9_9RHOB|nr:peptide chain release factor N(5)-glutamine methyltransferase [Roseovarius indicus]KRS17867.1 SAM-dependent methyltransferase [Roseovarius indicus]QEW27328.1 Release factor glutamine methyltransferase [Roseovarius indicus]SFD50261.1 [protein release factor]-glutamine N5-methyltransferase [Roseovarius indicus]